MAFVDPEASRKYFASPMELRSYRATDLDAVAELFTNAVHIGAQDVYDEAQRAAWAPRPPDRERWRKRLGALEMLVAVAPCGEELLGFVGFERDGHIDLLFTAPKAVRRGVATALYRQAEEELRAAGVRIAFTEASLVARPFFEREGYAVVEEQHVERDGVRLRRFAMTKPLL